MNPQVLNALALAIIGDDGPSAFPGLPTPDLAAARKDAAGIKAAARALHQAAPDAGCYVSESDYFLEDWQQAYWGGNWSRLSQIKLRMTPRDCSLYIMGSAASAGVATASHGFDALGEGSN